jgi:hypothetical protein
MTVMAKKYPVPRYIQIVGRWVLKIVRTPLIKGGRGDQRQNLSSI